MVYKDEDPLMGFVLLPDLKWDTKDLSNLYLVAIVQRRDLLSLRDLTAEHIPLLKHIMALGKVGVCVFYIFVYVYASLYTYVYACLYMLMHVCACLCMVVHVHAWLCIAWVPHERMFSPLLPIVDKE